MNVIVIFRADATNYWIKSIVKELQRRKHVLKCYIYSDEYINLQAIEDLNVKVNKIEALTPKDIDECDFIFGADDTIPKIANVKKPIITFNFAGVAEDYFAACGDLMLVPNYARYPKIKEDCVAITVGDTDYFCPKDCSDESKQILFIDSGHYPFGREGKRIVCQILLDICKKMADYTVKVKPRFLRSDKNVTHRNSIHLYDGLNEISNGCLPENLILMEEYGDLNQLIDESKVVICMYTTAFFKVVKRRKKAIILDNLPNQDACNLTNEWHWNIVREVYKKSGCLVDYRDALNYLPEGLECDKEFLDKYVPFSDRTDCCEKTVDAIEHVNEHFFSVGKFLKSVNTDILNYEKDIEEDIDGNWNSVIKRRLRNEVAYRTSRLFDEVDQELQLEEYLKWANEQIERNNNWSEKSLVELREKMYRKRLSYIVNSYDRIKGTPRKEAVFYDSLYKLNSNLISELDCNSSGCVRALYYYKAFQNINCMKIKEAFECFERYYALTIETDFDEVLTDKEFYINRAKGHLIFNNISHDSRIAIYGAGNWGYIYKQIIYKMGVGKLVCFYDRNASHTVEDEVPVLGIDRISDDAFDYIVISVSNEKINKEIKGFLLEKGVCSAKILTVYDYE